MRGIGTSAPAAVNMMWIKTYFIASMAFMLVSNTAYGQSESALCDNAERAYDIDFAGAIVTTNTLHLGGSGELRYENLGSTYNGRAIDFVVKVVPGTTYTTPEPSLNGRSGFYGQINVQNRIDDDPALDGVGEFEFCFVDHETDSPVSIDSFDFTILDLDSRGDLSFEKVTADPTQYEFYQLLSSPRTSTVAVRCETSGGSPPCRSNDDNICFISNESGNNNDNPTSDPRLSLSTVQQRRSVLFTFRNKSCFQFKFEQVCNDGPGTCNVGGNFIFAATSQRPSSSTSDCVTGTSRSDSGGSVPTSPTRAPVTAPNPAPTGREPRPESPTPSDVDDDVVSDGDYDSSDGDRGKGKSNKDKKPKSGSGSKKSKKLQGKGKGNGSGSKNSSGDMLRSKKEKKPKSTGNDRKHSSKKLVKNQDDDDNYDEDNDSSVDDDDYVYEPTMDSEDVIVEESYTTSKKNNGNRRQRLLRR